MPDCERCGRAYKTPATLARHLASDPPCPLGGKKGAKGTKGKKGKPEARRAEAGPADAGPADAGPADAGPADAPAEVGASGSKFGRALWRARDIMRRAGVTGLEALDCVATLIVWRELGRLFPTMGDRASYNERHLDTAEVREAHARGVFTFEQFCETDNPRLNSVWSAISCLYAGPARSARPIFRDIQRIYPITGAASQELARLVAAEIRVGAADDPLGTAFMSVVGDFLDGKELGQFFTPKVVVEVAVREAADGGRPLGAVLDPTCGSGGFLAAALRAGAAAVGGLEIDKRVALLAYASTLMADGKAHPDVLPGDFLRGAVPVIRAAGQPPTDKYDTVLANPPFGMKKIDRAELIACVGDTGAAAYPYKTSATGLFIQRIVHSAKVGGRICVVLPLGHEVGGKKAGDVRFRRALAGALTFRKVFDIPGGTFENTPVRTVLVVADKRAELVGGAVPADLPAVTFVGLDGSASRQFPAAALADRGWSLSPDDYRPVIVRELAPGYTTRKLGDLFGFRRGQVQASKNIDGPYTFVSVPDEYRTHAAYDHDCEAIVLVSASVGCNGKVHYVSGKFAASTITTVLTPKVGDMCTKYVYWYLRLRRADLEKSQYGVKPTLSIDAIANIDIVLPPADHQAAIAAELDDLADCANSARRIASGVRIMTRYTLTRALYTDFRQIPREDVVRRRADEVCRIIRGKSITRAELISGPFPAIGGGITPLGTHSEHNRPAGSTTISLTGASAGYVARHATPIYCGGHAGTIDANGVNPDYLYHYLAFRRPELSEMRTGLAAPEFDKHAFSSMPIDVPSEATQTELAQKLDALEAKARAYEADAAAFEAQMAQLVA